MKKIMKLSKIFLLIVTVFSYIASPISVFAEEIITNGLKPLILNLDVNDVGDKYILSYISSDPSDYEETKVYKIELETTITYSNGDEQSFFKEEFSVNGTDLNNIRGSKLIDSPVDEKYNADYILDVSVYDDSTLVYSEELKYETNYTALVGLTGKLNEETTGELFPVNEEVSEITVGNYDVTEGMYTQEMSILPGELSPLGEYRVIYDNDGVVTYSDVMSADELSLILFEGAQTDLTDKLYGVYSYTDTVTFEEVFGNEIDGYEIEKSYTYNYDAALNYGSDNDELFSDKYQTTFEDGYMIVLAKGLGETQNVITIGEILAALSDSNITLEVLDEEGNVLDLINEEVLANEIKNGYILNFTSGVTASYEVVVVGDNNLDNDFTNDDLIGVIDGYIDEEDMLSMDMTYFNDSDDSQKFGTITFEDVVITNELFKEEINLDREEIDNENLGFEFNDLSSEIYVGDIVELEVLLSKKQFEDIIEGDSVLNAEEDTMLDGSEEENESSDEMIEFIDGIDANIKLSDNLRMKEIRFNDVLTGSYSESGRIVAVGDMLYEEDIFMTLVLEVTSLGNGNASVELSGKNSKFLNIDEFESIITEFDVIRKFSSNNNLTSLDASIGTFDVPFDKDVTVYTLTVPYDTESVILSGSLEDMYSDVDGLIEYELSGDKTTAIITVTAEDGSTKVYTVYIIKETAPVVAAPIVYYYSSNNYLKSLEVEGYDIDFDKYTNEYKLNVKNGVTSLDIVALAEDSDARVEITGNSDFNEGENIVTIAVTAENGNIREYKLIVNVDEKILSANEEGSSNTAEKIVIIILIVLVVLGLLYLIFKKDEEVDEKVISNNNDDNKKEKNINSSNKNINNKKKK